MSRNTSSSAPCGVVERGQLDRIARVADVEEARALDDAAGVDVHAGDHALVVHAQSYEPRASLPLLIVAESRSSARRWSQVPCASRPGVRWCSALYPVAARRGSAPRPCSPPPAPRLDAGAAACPAPARRRRGHRPPARAALVVAVRAVALPAIARRRRSRPTDRRDRSTRRLPPRRAAAMTLRDVRPPAPAHGCAGRPGRSPEALVVDPSPCAFVRGSVDPRSQARPGERVRALSRRGPRLVAAALRAPDRPTARVDVPLATSPAHGHRRPARPARRRPPAQPTSPGRRRAGRRARSATTLARGRHARRARAVDLPRPPAATRRADACRFAIRLDSAQRDPRDLACGRRLMPPGRSDRTRPSSDGLVERAMHRADVVRPATADPHRRRARPGPRRS